MIDLKIEGDKHPKTVKLVTDDANAENVLIANALDDMEIGQEDPFRQWFDEASADELKEGVVIPEDMVGEWADVLDGLDAPGAFEAAQKIEELRREYVESSAGAGRQEE